MPARRGAGALTSPVARAFSYGLRVASGVGTASLAAGKGGLGARAGPFPSQALLLGPRGHVVLHFPPPPPPRHAPV